MDNYKIGDEVELLEDFYTRSGAELIFKKGTIAKVIELQLYDEIHIDVNGDNRWCSPDILKLVDKKDPALISGADALANVHKCIVQYLHDDEPYGRWTTITDHFWSQYHLGMFLDPDTKFKFRFKPQTIKLELELPKPFEPEEDCHVYILDDGKTDGYRRYSYEVHGDKGNTFIGIWRTEEEIKQVVEQLRKIRGTNL
ncbi:hypothetical protein [Acinetobacter baumannii]